MTTQHAIDREIWIANAAACLRLRDIKGERLALKRVHAANMALLAIENERRNA